ncbi:hypothetical protein U1Q18_009835 [Sarracenia purpurea var. burkii]
MSSPSSDLGSTIRTDALLKASKVENFLVSPEASVFWTLLERWTPFIHGISFRESEVWWPPTLLEVGFDDNGFCYIRYGVGFNSAYMVLVLNSIMFRVLLLLRFSNGSWIQVRCAKMGFMRRGLFGDMINGGFAFSVKPRFGVGICQPGEEFQIISIS